MRSRFTPPLLFMLMLLPRLLMAWGAAGHEVIAAEAYRTLPPQFKAEAIEVLKAHPDFVKWQNAYHPNGNFDVYAYIFMRSSTWPDAIRRSGNKHDHPNWHFIDYPLRPPKFAFEPGPKPDDDVLFGVAQCEKTLSDIYADPELRAASLSFLIHLVGDMHQPLHCASLFTGDYPNGDKGGNDFYVKPAQRGVRLHSIWDGLLGTSANPRTHWNYAIEIDNKYPLASLPELAAHTTPKAWSLESRQLAIDKAYLDGELNGATGPTDAPPLPADYTKQAKQVAERQAALAGYRLADEIEKYLKCAGAVPLLPVSVIAETPTAAPKRVGADEAKNFYNQEMIVTGKVAQVSVRRNVSFLNIDKPFPDSTLTAVIFEDHLSQFGDLQKFNNQKVEIRGTVTEYHGKPEIILESPNQLKIIGGN